MMREVRVQRQAMDDFFSNYFSSFQIDIMISESCCIERCELYSTQTPVCVLFNNQQANHLFYLFKNSIINTETGSPPVATTRFQSFGENNLTTRLDSAG